MAWIKTHLKCPVCPSSDAYSIGTTGSKCFACGYYKSSKQSYVFEDIIDIPFHGLPADSITTYPAEFHDYLKTFELDNDPRILYSPSLNRLVIPIKGLVKDEIVGYLARSINSLPKWKTSFQSFPWGKKYPAAYLCSKTDPIVLVEDVFSAMKVGKVTNCMALLGCSLNSALRQLLLFYGNNFIIWLDNDKAGEKGRQQVESMLQLVCKVSHIRTDHDPKYYTVERIKELIKAAA